MKSTAFWREILRKSKSESKTGRRCHEDLGAASSKMNASLGPRMMPNCLLELNVRLDARFRLMEIQESLVK